MITKLEWDSNFFGYNIASLNSANGISFENIENYVRDNSIDFIQTLCNVENVSIIRTLEDNNFHFADLKVTFSLNIGGSNCYGEKKFDLATKDDKENICRIASNSFVDSRYYGHEIIFSRIKVNEMFSVWAEKSILGQFDDCCLKVLDGNSLLGFITLRIRDNTTAVIGILAVDEKFRGKGVGTALLQSLFDYLSQKGVSKLEVSTQGKNIVAQNLYIKHGFRVSKLESWYYYYTGRMKKN